MKKILILANSASGLYDFRNELILRLLEEYEVHISLPDEEKAPELAKEGCIVYHTPLDRRGINPVRDLKLFMDYWNLIGSVKPAAVLTYTIKPNIYGGLCARLRGTPYITSITGLGSAFENGGILQKIVVLLYRIALKNASCVFFQNSRNREIFNKNKIRGKCVRLVSGSGVNLDRHGFKEYPCKEERMILLYVGRIMKEKGTDELLYTAKALHNKYPDVVFKLVGNYEDDYKESVEQYERDGIIEHISYQKDIIPFYKEASAVIMPSYHEGMSNVILEASANARPVLASLIPGCREAFDDGITGIGFQPKDKDALLSAVQKFIGLPYEERVEMGKKARLKMEREFDRKHVSDAYMEEINKMAGGKH